jgi:hypothetical protein
MKLNNPKLKDIKSGDLIAWTSNKGFYNKLIRLTTLSEYTHVGIAVIENGKLYVVEATRPVVRKVELSSRTPFYHIPMGVIVDTVLTKVLEDFIGKQYSIIQAMLSVFNIYINDDKWYCTELCYEFYKKAGIEFDKRLTPTKFVKQAISYSDVINNIEN